MADKYGVGNELLKRAIVEAGIAGRLDKYSEGDGFGLFDGLAMQFNSLESNVEYVLTKKGMLKVLQSEIADNAFHPSAQNFRTVMAAVDTAYDGGFNKFVQDNATTLIKNTPFMRYADQKTRDMVEKAVNNANGNGSSPSYATDRTPSKGAGKTLGQLPQPTGLPKPTPNSSSNTQKGKGNGSNNSKPQSPPKPTTSSNANSSQGNKTIKTGQSGNNWERTKQRYLPDWLRN